VRTRLQRLVALLVLAVPIALVGLAGATWGAARTSGERPREPHELAISALAAARGDEDRDESAVVLVVLDGVRWQEVFYGADRAMARQRGMNPLAWANPRDLMPNLYRLLDRHGVAIGAPGRGAEITATGPQFISLPGYLEIFGGRPDPVCDRNDCARPPARTIADDVVDSSGPRDVAVVTSWPNIAKAASADPSRFALTSGRKLMTQGDAFRDDPAEAALLERGASASAWPGVGDYRPDAITARIALRHLQTSRPRFLFIGLGDADEYAHRNDYHGYLEALHESDAVLGKLAVTLEALGARGRHTAVLVTADHGRAYDFRDHGRRYPESGRVWLVAGGGDVHGHGIVSAARRYTLSDVAPTVRALLGIAGAGPDASASADRRSREGELIEEIAP
jgi:hypothetical protein